MSAMPTINYQDLISRFQQQQTAANAANENRYQDILKTYDTAGRSAKTSAAKAAKEGTAQDTQSLISRGLYNTGTLDATRRGRQSDLTDQNSAIDENVASQRAGVMERRTDQAPDMGIYAQLLQQAGAAQSQASPGRSQTTVGAVPGGSGRSYSSGGGGGGGSPSFGSTGGGGSSSGGNYASVARSGGLWGMSPAQQQALRGGGNVDAVEGPDGNRTDFDGPSDNPATNALRRMTAGYSNSIGG